MNQSSFKQKIIVVTGATATGKSDYAIKLAKENNGEIIGADSVQIFRGLNIGSGKVTSQEMDGVPHHMIDILNPCDEYSVSDYVSAAREKISQIAQRGRLPIVVGGTGLYIKCLLEGHNFGQSPKDESIRNKYKQLLADEGKESLHKLLKRIDPVSADKISVNDTKRVIRALEIFEITGIPKSQAVTTSESDYDFRMLVLFKQKEVLYPVINSRVDKMFESGLVDEVRQLIDYKDCQSMQSIGYKETVDYILGNCTLDEAKELVKLNSRHYAKRQMTFFRGIKCEKEWVNTI